MSLCGHTQRSSLCTSSQHCSGNVVERETKYCSFLNFAFPRVAGGQSEFHECPENRGDTENAQIFQIVLQFVVLIAGDTTRQGPIYFVAVVIVDAVSDDIQRSERHDARCKYKLQTEMSNTKCENRESAILRGQRIRGRVHDVWNLTDCTA